MILSAYSLFLALNVAPALPQDAPVAAETVFRPSEPVSMAVGDALGLEMIDMHRFAVPESVAAREAIAASTYVAWADASAVPSLALTH